MQRNLHSYGCTVHKLLSIQWVASVKKINIDGFHCKRVARVGKG